MIPGSLQLRLYRIARRDGRTRSQACAESGICETEAKLIDADDAKFPPSPDCYLMPLGMARRVVGELADTPLGAVAINRLVGA